MRILILKYSTLEAINDDDESSVLLQRKIGARNRATSLHSWRLCALLHVKRAFTHLAREIVLRTNSPTRAVRCAKLANANSA